MEILKKYGIKQFDGKDFQKWKFRMEKILEEENLSQFINRGFDRIPAAERRNDKRAQNIIVQCTADSQLDLIIEKKTAKEMWDAILKSFEQKGITGQLGLRKKLTSMKMGENDDIENHLREYESTVRELKQSGMALQENDINCNLLLTLPDSFQTLVTVIENLPEEEQTYEEIKKRLRNENEKRKQQQKDQTATVPTRSSESVAFNTENQAGQAGQVGSNQARSVNRNSNRNNFNRNPNRNFNRNNYPNRNSYPVRNNNFDPNRNRNFYQNGANRRSGFNQTNRNNKFNRNFNRA